MLHTHLYAVYIYIYTHNSLWKAKLPIKHTNFPSETNQLYIFFQIDSYPCFTQYLNISLHCSSTI